MGRIIMAKKILVVDDDPDLVETTSMILKSKQYDVVVAYDGVEGLEKAKTEKPDLIVLDVMMPALDGIEVCRAVRADGSIGDVRILLLSASVDDASLLKY